MICMLASTVAAFAQAPKISEHAQRVDHLVTEQLKQLGYIE